MKGDQECPVDREALRQQIEALILSDSLSEEAKLEMLREFMALIEEA